jgi:hypothetical protein
MYIFKRLKFLVFPQVAAKPEVTSGQSWILPVLQFEQLLQRPGLSCDVVEKELRDYESPPSSIPA